MAEFRKLKPQDGNRIKCCTINCDNNASTCRTVPWEVGKVKSVSFFYYCSECIASIKAKQAQRRAAA